MGLVPTGLQCLSDADKREASTKGRGTVGRWAKVMLQQTVSDGSGRMAVSLKPDWVHIFVLSAACWMTLGKSCLQEVVLTCTQGKYMTPSRASSKTYDSTLVHGAWPLWVWNVPCWGWRWSSKVSIGCVSLKFW